MKYIVMAAILIIGGLIFATKAHFALQEIEGYRQAFGGAVGIALTLTDILGATNTQEAIAYLQNIRSVSIGAIVVGVLLGLFGIAKSVNSGHPAPERESALGSRRGAYKKQLLWNFSRLDKICGKCGDRANGDASDSISQASYCVKCGSAFQTIPHTVLIQGSGFFKIIFTVALDGVVVGEYRADGVTVGKYHADGLSAGKNQAGRTTAGCEFPISGYQAYIETAAGGGKGWSGFTHKLYVDGELIA